MDVQDDRWQAARIEHLLQEVASFPDEQVRERIEQLLQELLALYGEALARIRSRLEQSGASGQALWGLLAEDELIGALFLLYGLHPVPLETRLLRVLERVRSTLLKERGSTIELVKLEDGEASVRVHIAGNHCSSSLGALQQSIEAAIYAAAPELVKLNIEGGSAAKRAVPVTFQPRRRQGAAGQSVDVSPIAGTR
jgi:Fe-S cluster biogenesis protein NfuA